MSKNSDLVQILFIVILGMFIPFLVSLVIMFDLSPLTTEGLLTIGSTFGYFLLIFGLELLIVYIYFYSTNKIAQKKIDNEARKKEKK